MTLWSDALHPFMSKTKPVDGAAHLVRYSVLTVPKNLLGGSALPFRTSLWNLFLQFSKDQHHDCIDFYENTNQFLGLNFVS